MVTDAFCYAFAQLVQFNNEYVCRPDQFVHIARSISTDRSMSRNVLCSQFLGDWLLMLDADHVFEPDLLLRLLILFESANLDVLSGVYVSKNPPHLPMIQFREKPNDGWKIVSGWSPRARLVQFGRGGAGCLLIRRRVLERIAAELGEEPFAYNNNFSEDFSFFTRLEALGIPAHAACQVHLDHLFMASVNVSNFKPDATAAYEPEVPVPTVFSQQFCDPVA